MDVLRLLWPKWRTIRNGSRKPGERVKTWFLLALGIAFAFVIFFAAHYILAYIKDLYVGPGLELQELRFEINRRLLGMAVMTFLAVLVFSNIITALTTFFLSEDLELVGALPVSADALFAARFIEMITDSSWMVLAFGTPVFLAFGFVYQANWAYYAMIPAVGLPFLLIPAAIGVMVTMALVSAFPARRIRDILLLLAIIAAGFLFMLLRLLQPEKLVNPDAQMSVLAFVQSLQAPMKSWMPNLWATEVLAEMAQGRLLETGQLYLLLLWGTGLGLTACAMLFARHFYPDSFSKSQEATRIVISRTSLVNRIIAGLSSPFRPATRQLVMKDFRVFMRDTSQWSQVFLLGALMVIYVFNFRAMPLSRLPIDQFKIQNVVSFMNIGLAGFVISALSARFVFPMVSLEGRAFWIIKTSPLPLRGFLWSKFFIAAVPLLLIGETLIVITNSILEVSTIVWYAGVITIALMTLSICGLGVGLGARFPRFTVENPAKVAASFGGVLYMIISMTVIGLVVLLEAWPTYVYFMAGFKGLAVTPSQAAWIAGNLTLAAAILVGAIFVPMRLGLRSLDRMEF